jgi:eukaryotic-like serine/threonine-protein kinase
LTYASSPWVDLPYWKTNWEVIEPLNGGGQGLSFRVQRRSNGIIGFLKTIKSKKDPERRARFFREATAYESFGIPGVPSLIESNAHLHASLDYTPYVVTDFIDGATLEVWRKAQTDIPIDTAVLVVSRLLDILSECHKVGCIHRDIKPDNIILAGLDPSRVWLLDFGLSYHNFSEQDFRTETPQEVGNRFLRLPELSAGSQSKQDIRSDISFAAGILFYLLTGNHPDTLVDGDGRMPHQRPEALEKLQAVAGKRLSQILTFFDRSFEIRLSSRFSSVDEMKSALSRVTESDPEVETVEEGIAALKRILDTAANRRLADTASKFRLALESFQEVAHSLNSSLGGHFLISQTGWSVGVDQGESTLFWSKQGSNERFLTVTSKTAQLGDELVVRVGDYTIFRTSFDEPDFGAEFSETIRAWLVVQLRAALG